jgi:hypothetical protein
MAQYLLGIKLIPFFQSGCHIRSRLLHFVSVVIIRTSAEEEIAKQFCGSEFTILRIPMTEN